MEVRVALIEPLPTGPGTFKRPGEVLVVSQREARRLVAENKAVFYSESKASMIEGVEEDGGSKATPEKEKQSRVKKAPKKAASTAKPGAAE